MSASAKAPSAPPLLGLDAAAIARLKESKTIPRPM
jgi:hypothetical protein